jgi:hypothetical protein
MTCLIPSKAFLNSGFSIYVSMLFKSNAVSGKTIG